MSEFRQPTKFCLTGLMLRMSGKVSWLTCWRKIRHALRPGMDGCPGICRDPGSGAENPDFWTGTGLKATGQSRLGQKSADRDSYYFWEKTDHTGFHTKNVICKFFVDNFILYNQLLLNENAASSLENLLNSSQNKVSVIF